MDVRVDKAEPRVGGGEAHVARERELRTAAERGTVQHRDRRHREQTHGVQRRGRSGGKRLGRFLVARTRQVGEVGPGAESDLAGAAEDRQPEVVEPWHARRTPPSARAKSRATRRSASPAG